MTAEEILQQVESDVESESEKSEEEQKGEKNKGDSTFCREMGLDEDKDFDCSYWDPDYHQESREANLLSSSSEQECLLEESFMSGKRRGVKRKKGAGGG